jgi:protein TonB
MPAFEHFLTQEKAKPKKWIRITIFGSIALHAVLLVAGAVYSFWHVDEISPPSVTVTFLSVAAAPPPPPPAAKKKTNIVKPRVPVEVVQPRPNQIVQPKDKPPPEPEDDDDGVEGGVEGGVKGGVVGGTGNAPVEAPKMLPPNIAKGNLLIDPGSDQYRPKLPPALNRQGTRLFAMVKVCVKKDGLVDSVQLVKGADPLVDPEISAKVRTWRYRPYAIDGRPVPFCFMMRLDLSAQ